MKMLDYDYLGDLMKKAQGGDTTSFAELYAATYSRVYVYAYRFLQDEELAKEALRKIYGRAMAEMRTLQTPKLFMAWLNRISFQVCYDIRHYYEEQGQPDLTTMEEELIKIGPHEYSLQQIMRLPLTEAQVLIQHYYLNIPIKESAKNLDVSPNSVQRYLYIGKTHLKKLLGNA
jgi:DNA-directed RNA polymerase specialized sigma24 family protein